MDFLNQLKFDEKGLIPAIIQDEATGEVLMMGYMNRESIEKTIQSGRVHFWSRSRQKLWLKGESSGHYQEVKQIYFDCDADTLLIKVNQIGGACHTGYRSCFYRRVEEGGKRVEVIGNKVFDPQKAYSQSGQ